MKGQMFIIGSLIVVVILILLRTSINVGDVLEKKKFLEVGVEKLEFANLRSEIPKAAFNTINATQDTTNVTNSFIAFAEDKLSARTMRLDGLSINSAYGNLSASTNIPLNVTVFNFFDVDLTNVILNLSTNFAAPVNFSNVEPRGVRSTQFTLNLASSQNLTMWVFYQTSTESVTQNITILADTTRKTKFVGYFDLRMISDRGTIRDRFSETVNVN